jgi:hypothetical protein
MRTVEELPILDQSAYGAIPVLPEGMVLKLAATPWASAEPEFMAAGLLQTIIDAGEGKALSEVEIAGALMRFGHYRFMSRAFVDGFGVLQRTGDIEAVDYQGTMYVILQPSLAIKALRSGSAVMAEPAYVARIEPTIIDEPDGTVLVAAAGGQSRL